MLSFAPRCPLPCRIGEAVYDKIIGSSEVTWTEAKRKCIKEDCDYLQDLRCDIERSGKDIGVEVLLEYLSCLQSVLLKLDLENFGFVWTNSIGCSRAPVQGLGLRFECLNVLFNIGSCYMRKGAALFEAKDWQGAKVAFQLASGVLVRARESEFNQLSHSPPVELQSTTLAFLYCLNKTQASECQFMITQNPSDAWEIHWHYYRLANGPTANSTLKEWQPALAEKTNHMASLACLTASYAYRGTRKKAEQALEYAALLKALELSVDEDVRAEALRLIEQPRGRRHNTSLSASVKPAEFVQENYFGSFEMVLPIPFTIPKSLHTMLAKLLPLTIASAPLILSEKLKSYVEKELCSQLYNINRYVRSIMVKCNAPCSIELLRSSSAAPESLIRIGARIRKLGGLKHLQDVAELGSQEALHCDSVIRSVHMAHAEKDELQALQDCVSAGLSALQLIQSKLGRSAHLIEILERGESHIARFIGNSAPKNTTHASRATSKQRSSAFFDKADAFFATLGHQVYERSQKCIQLEAKAKEYNFFNPVMSLIDSCEEPREWALKDLKGCFDAALAEFDADKQLIQEEKLRAEDTVQELLRLEKELRRFRHGMNKVDEEKLKAAQCLMFAALEFYDISYNLSESSRYFSTLNTAVANFRERCNRPSTTTAYLEDSFHDVRKSPGEYTWRPGMTVNFI